MVEETEKGSAREVRILTPVYPRQHVGRRGADITSGQSLFAPGDVVTPSRVGALAAMGLTAVDVFARPRVAILSTGNEIVAPGEPLGPGQLYDINQFTLAAIVSAHGGVPIVYPTAADNLDALRAAVDAAAGDDLLIFSGGSSVGERDLIIDVIAGMGEVIFHGIAVKPGKPTAFGRIDRRPIFGMPGYATSCLSNAYMLLVPMLRRIARLPEYQPHRSCGCPFRAAWCRRPAGISSTPCESNTMLPCRPSRPPATSPAWRRPTATSRSPHRPTS